MGRAAVLQQGPGGAAVHASSVLAAQNIRTHPHPVLRKIADFELGLPDRPVHALAVFQH